MKKTMLVLAFAAAGLCVFAQKKTTTSAVVAFDATTPKDELPKAENKTAIAALDTKTGAVNFEAAVKNFAFSNPTIQEHFNGERWLNSDKFQTFVFKGKITDLSAVNFKKDGTYTVNVAGDMTVKGVTKPVTTPATLVVKGGVVTATAEFPLTLADYGVMADGNKVAKEPKIKVQAEFK